MSGIDVAVIGGGIAGSSVAYHLADRTDASITLFERRSMAGETTAKSAAFFGFYGGEVERRMKRYAMALYNEFLSEPRAAPHHELVGRVRVATTSDGAAAVTDRAEGAPVDDMAGDDAAQSMEETVLLPELDTDSVVGASYRPGVGYHRPRELAREFTARAEELGVRFRTGTPVVDIVTEENRVKELLVEDGSTAESVEPRAVVCAAGPWNPHLLGRAGLEFPVSHSAAPILRLGRRDVPTHTLPIVSHVESGVYVRGDGPDAVLVGHYPTGPETETFDDPDDVGKRVPEERRRVMRSVVGELLPPLADAPVVDEWVGVRSHTPDGAPIVGWTDVERLSVVAFDSSGIQLAPAAGRIVAAQIVDDEPTEHYPAVSISRFDGHRDRQSTVDR